MKPTTTALRDLLPVLFLTGAASWLGTMNAGAAPGQTTNEVRIIQIEGGTVEVIPKGAAKGVATATTNLVLRVGDRLRTGLNTRVALLWSDQSVIRLKPATEIEILAVPEPGAGPGLRLLNGILSFFHRDKPGRIRILSSGTAAGVDGTEFVMEVASVNNTERTTIFMIDGRVRLSNDQATVTLINGQQGTAEAGRPPVVTTGFVANNILQWCFYYPAVLDLDDLPLRPAEQQALAESLAAYRKGDLLEALAKYPPGRQPGSDSEKIYRAAILLSVGEVDQTESLLAGLTAGDPSARLQRLATALRELIAAVKRQENPSTLKPIFATEFLAASYFEQSRAVREDSLRAALALAKEASTNSPNFGFALERVAELEFSFGRTARAMDTLNKSIALAPRNAQSLALRGFLFAAQNRIRQAIEQFNDAAIPTPPLTCPALPKPRTSAL